MKQNIHLYGFLVLLAINSSLNADAQQNPDLNAAGGTGGGSARAWAAISLTDPVLSVIYAGGSADGDARIKFLGVFQNPLTPGVYTGGQGRGDFHLLSLMSLPNTTAAPVYRGGKGRGDSSEFFKFVLKDLITSPVYKGGIGRGDSSFETTGYLKDAIASSAYTGGYGRGDVTISTFAPLKDIYSPMYTGGIGRGDYAEYFKAELVDLSNTRQMLVETTLDSKTFSVKVQPNPSADVFQLRVTGSNEGVIRLRISDAMGRLMQEKVLEGGVQQLQLGDSWQNGTYFLEVIQGSERKVLRLLKLK